MADDRTKGSERDTGFSFVKNIAAHKPGFEQGSTEREEPGSTDHRFKRSDKALPKGTLAERFAKKGG